MAKMIQGAEQALQDVFSDRYQLRIPEFQRPYSWTEEQSAELIDDLWASYTNEGSIGDEAYFLGSIVLAKEEHDPSSDVIDGQQRLTTLSVLFAVLATELGSEHSKHLRTFLYQEGNPFKGTKDRPRLTLRERDQAFFQKYVQYPADVTDLLALDPGGLSTDSQQYLQKNARLLLDWIQKVPSEELSHFVEHLVQRTFLVVVSSPNVDTAFRIFTVLNDRGLDLSPSDILKAEVVGKIKPPEDQAEYSKKWEDAEEDLNREAFNELFAHLRMIYAKAKQRVSLLDEFRDHVMQGEPEPRALIDDVIVPYAGLYRDIAHSMWSSTTLADDVNHWLEWLGRIDNIDWIPPAMRFMREHQQEPSLIVEFLRRLERLATSMFVRRVDITRRVRRYGELLEDMDNGIDVLREPSGLELGTDEKVETLQQLKGEIYTFRRTRRYVLLRLDEALSAGGAKYDYKVITVEHVLPQSPPPDSKWITQFSEGEREYWTHRLANLVLLPRQRNSAAQNYDFEKKKRQYFTSGDGTSPFVVTTQVIEEDEWRPDVLERRQEALVNRLAEVWELA